jgi:exodeoxyribonuclease V alpha subunit
VLFVGDPDQLSPVGRGAPLRDLIAAGLSCGKLTEIRRNSGAIVEACACIRDNIKIQNIATSSEQPENLRLVHLSQDIDRMIQIIEKIADHEFNDNYKKMLNNMQIITAINTNSPLSREKFNKILQEKFNPFTASDLETKNKKFHVGDKIICNTNGIAIDAHCGELEYMIANGDVGFIQDIFVGEMLVEVNGQLIRVPAFSDTWGESNWELGYAISCHKSQGSEWEIVVIVLDNCYTAGMVCDKHWIYTAISRAKQKCYLLGNMSSVEVMQKVSKMWDRKTLLKEQIEKHKWNNLNNDFLSLLNQN